MFQSGKNRQNNVFLILQVRVYWQRILEDNETFSYQQGLHR